MDEKINYQKIFDEQLNIIKLEKKKPTLLLHACCAPCSSYVLEYLNSFFDITLYFYNPNIAPFDEYIFRANELTRLVNEMNLSDDVKIIIAEYTPNEFTKMAIGKEDEQERGSRCTNCYSLRLKKTFEHAQINKFDYFSTTLSISPHKDAVRLNNIGFAISENSSVKWLYSDFKKKNGYKRSIELSEKHRLYRQNYCGCIYSKK
ncbi:MAG: epoxyqueuosine reductase QueH [Clostridia bacterium]|nr:epoxyqueuosine reductase QueH [Clostridia bacterium]